MVYTLPESTTKIAACGKKKSKGKVWRKIECVVNINLKADKPT
jgi:hypothetical protein